MRIVMAAIVAAFTVDLIHTTSGPGNLFTKFFVYMDESRDRGPAWSIAADAAACRRCMSVYVAALVYALSFIKPVYGLFASAMIASKVVQAIEPPEELT